MDWADFLEVVNVVDLWAVHVCIVISLRIIGLTLPLQSWSIEDIEYGMPKLQNGRLGLGIPSYRSKHGAVRQKLFSRDKSSKTTERRAT